RYYAGVAARIDANRAARSVARKLARRSHHILRRLGDQAYAPSRPAVKLMRAEAAALSSRCTVATPVAGPLEPPCPPPRARQGRAGLERLARPHSQRDPPIDHHVAETTAGLRTEVSPGARSPRTRRSPSPRRRNP